MMQQQYSSDLTQKDQSFKTKTMKVNSLSELIDNNTSSLPKELYDQVNVRLPVELNDWLNSVVRSTKRLHGSKIPKEIIIESAIRFLMVQDLDWKEIKNKEDLLTALETVLSDK